MTSVRMTSVVGFTSDSELEANIAASRRILAREDKSQMTLVEERGDFLKLEKYIRGEHPCPTGVRHASKECAKRAVLAHMADRNTQGLGLLWVHVAGQEVRIIRADSGGATGRPSERVFTAASRPEITAILAGIESDHILHYSDDGGALGQAVMAASPMVSCACAGGPGHADPLHGARLHDGDAGKDTHGLMAYGIVAHDIVDRLYQFPAPVTLRMNMEQKRVEIVRQEDWQNGRGPKIGDMGGFEHTIQEDKSFLSREEIERMDGMTVSVMMSGHGQAGAGRIVQNLVLSLPDAAFSVVQRLGRPSPDHLPLLEQKR